MRLPLLSQVLASVTLFACASNEPVAPASPANPSASDLVAYFPFDGDASDRSGNGFHGTPAGATLTRDRFGVAGKAYQFNGAAEIRTPIRFSSSNLTVATWLSLDAFRCWGGILDGFREKWEFVMNCGAGDQMQFAEWRSAVAFANHVDPTKLQLRRWYHLAVTINGTTGRFYLDGVPVSSFQLSAPALTNPAQLVMGHSASGTSQFLVGALDEVRLYARALSTDEVRALCKSEAQSGHSCA